MPEWLIATLWVGVLVVFFIGREWWNSHHKNKRWWRDGDPLSRVLTQLGPEAL